MKNKISKITALITVALLTLGTFSTINLPIASASPGTLVKVCPSQIELGAGGQVVIGKDVLVGVVVENVADLYGFDIRLSWNTEYFAYLNHTVTVPWNDTRFQNPMPPCNYAGLLYAPAMEAFFNLDPLAGKIEVSWASRAPAPSFYGSGMAYYIWFRVIKQPYDYEGDVTFNLTLYTTKLSDKAGKPIPHEKVHGKVIIRARPFVYPSLPLLDIKCSGVKSFSAEKMNQEFPVDIYLLDLDPFWDIQGFDMYLNFNKSLVSALNSTIDPDNRWKTFWPGGVFIIINEISNTEGYVRLVFLGLPSMTPPYHTPPYGTIRLARIWFKAIFESEKYPPPSFTFTLENPSDKKPTPVGPWGPEYFLIKIASHPHPERPMAPWLGRPWSPPVPHVVSGASYRAPFKPPGRWIDLYLWGIEACDGTRWEYADYAKGIGPNEPADAVQPQAKVILKALVTYNLNPVQSKIVVFEIKHGEFHFIKSAITDENGIATIIFTIPWPCVNPEQRVFGQWHVTATVDIVKVVINDTLTFEVGYLINIVSVTPLKDAYVIGEHMAFKITYDCISKQRRDAVFTVTVYDDLGVAIGYKMVPVTGITKGRGYEIILDCMTVPKWTFVGKGTVYANALENLPSCGGAAYCPERSNTFGLTAK